MVLAFAFFLMLTVATMLFLGRGDYSDLKSHWIPGKLVLAVLSAVLFFTTRYWTKWIIGIASYVFAKSLFAAPIFLLFGNLNVAKQFAIAVI
jgi:hypothetical protein